MIDHLTPVQPHPVGTTVLDDEETTQLIILALNNTFRFGYSRKIWEDKLFLIDLEYYLEHGKQLTNIVWGVEHRKNHEYVKTEIVPLNKTQNRSDFDRLLTLDVSESFDERFGKFIHQNKYLEFRRKKTIIEKLLPQKSKELFTNPDIVFCSILNFPKIGEQYKEKIVEKDKEKKKLQVLFNQEKFEISEFLEKVKNKEIDEDNIGTYVNYNAIYYSSRLARFCLYNEPLFIPYLRREQNNYFSLNKYDTSYYGLAVSDDKIYDEIIIDYYMNNIMDIPDDEEEAPVLLDKLSKSISLCASLRNGEQILSAYIEKIIEKIIKSPNMLEEHWEKLFTMTFSLPATVELNFLLEDWKYDPFLLIRLANKEHKKNYSRIPSYEQLLYKPETRKIIKQYGLLDAEKKDFFKYLDFFITHNITPEEAEKTNLGGVPYDILELTYGGE